MADSKPRTRMVATFRVARPASPRRLAARTGVQIVAVWGFALGVLPALAIQIDDRMRWRRGGHLVAGAALFRGGERGSG